MHRDAVSARAGGYTLVEIIVAILLFTIGGLALASTSAVVGRAMSASSMRERAARTAASRIEVLAAKCRRAESGSETIRGIDSRWTVSFPDSTRIGVVESVSYLAWGIRRTDLYGGLFPCA